MMTVRCLGGKGDRRKRDEVVDFPRMSMWQILRVLKYRNIDGVKSWSIRGLEVWINEFIRGTNSPITPVI